MRKVQKRKKATHRRSKPPQQQYAPKQQEATFPGGRPLLPRLLLYQPRAKALPITNACCDEMHGLRPLRRGPTHKWFATTQFGTATRKPSILRLKTSASRSHDTRWLSLIFPRT
jgi:hypothetical protein